MSKCARPSAAVDEIENKPSITTRMRVENIAWFVTIAAILAACPGILALLLGLAILVDAVRRGVPVDNASLGFFLGSLVFLGIGLFIFKLAADFRAFKSWTYPWVDYLTRWRLMRYFCRKDLYNQDVRKVFNQPEFEYPEHPEYGYKLEEKRKGQK